MTQSETAQEIISLMGGYELKHPMFDNVLKCLQFIKDDKRYRFLEQVDRTKNYTQDSTKVYTLINKASITGQK